MMKKAQGMSMKVIILAVLALIILVVLVLIFTGKVKIFGSQTSETQQQFSTRNCEVPGTNNACMDEDTCRERGGSWTAAPEDGYGDCHFFDDGCCSM